MLKNIAFALCFLAAFTAHAQKDSTQLSQLLQDFNIKASVGLQLWSTYSQGMKVLSPETNTYDAVDNRLNVQLRRSRFSLSGQPYATLQFKITAALDLVGHDVLAATEAGGNNGGSPNFRIWNAVVSWQLLPQKDHLYLNAGYFVSPIGRESNTAALRSNSFEKAWSQNYLRRHLTGYGPGRAMGMMLSGQVHNSDNNRHLTYEAAIQNPVFGAFGGNSTGRSDSPLLVGRLSFHFGDVENKAYSMNHKVNYFGKRNGLTLSLSGAQQGKTELFSTNSAYGAELLYNHADFQIDGDFFILYRSSSTSAPPAETKAATGYLRIGKNIRLPRQLVFEPVVSYWFFRGAKRIDDITTANELGSFSGSDTGLDIGGNLYFNPNTKLSLFYAHRAGSSGEANQKLINNNYYTQPGVGLVERGSYFGAGWVIIL